MDQKGFTVLELVVVIAVLAALTAIALPRFLCVIPWSQAVAASHALTNIQKECFIQKSLFKKSLFRRLNLNGYSVLSDGSNSCGGDPSTNLITAQPVDATELPIFYLNTIEGTISCSLNGSNYSNPKDCTSRVCGAVNQSNNPSNISTLFPSDSGKTCRVVDSNELPFGYGYVYLDGRDTVRDLEIQPVVIKAGNESWEINGVKTTIRRKSCAETGGRCSDNQWLVDFADAVVDKVNTSDTGYSAEKDSSQPGQIKFYSPSGELVDNISMDVDRSVIGAPWNSAANGTNPWAYPSLGGDLITDNKYYGTRTFNSGESSEGSTSTTICDGK